MMSLFKKLFDKEEIDYTDLFEKKVLIIDVRTPQEFMEGHAEGSINIPLSDLQNHLREIKLKNKPVITCCRSGARSSNAAAILKAAGIEAFNGGSWNQVQEKIAAKY